MSPYINSIDAKPKPVCRMLTPIGMLGYGFDEQEMHETLGTFARDGVPMALILDSGSTDSGPKKLARGDMTCPLSSYKRDMGRLLRGVSQHKVPLLIGSAGGAGTNKHVDVITDIVDNLSRENGYSLKTVKIYSEMSKDVVKQRLDKGNITGCGQAVPQLQQRDIDDAALIVAQMGAEPYLEAMERVPDYDVIIGGRAYDPAPYAAYAIACLKKIDSAYNSRPEAAKLIDGGIWHASKIMECGGFCSVPKAAGAVCTIFSDGSFEVVPTDQSARMTPLSVASHTFYEKSRPDILHGPGGWLDLSHAAYKQCADGRTVRVDGSTFHASVDNGLPYEIKLEAARTKGFGSIYMGHHKDPVLISQLDEHLARIRTYVANQVDGLTDGNWDLEWHVYPRERVRVPESVFLVGESRAESQELATAIIATARTATMHAAYPGQKATGGNFAFGIGALTEIPLGAISEFCIYHLMALSPGEQASLFPIEVCDINYSKAVNGNFVSQPKSQAEKRSSRKAPKKITATVTNLDNPRSINDVATVLRSKNAGPFEITFDILFDRPDVYNAVKSANLLSVERVAALYDMNPEQIVWNGFFDQAYGYKLTIPRTRRGVPCASGGYLEEDMHGSQMYIPLMKLELPDSLRAELRALQ